MLILGVSLHIRTSKSSYSTVNWATTSAPLNVREREHLMSSATTLDRSGGPISGKPLLISALAAKFLLKCLLDAKLVPICVQMSL